MVQVLNTVEPTLKKGFMEQTSSVVLRNAETVVEAQPGDAVKLSGYSNGIQVTAITAATDKIYGVIPFTPKRDVFTANGKEVRVVIDNAIVIMEASAAFAVGTELEIDPTTMKVATKTTGTLIGTAIQAAAADGDLVKVELKR